MKKTSAHRLLVFGLLLFSTLACAFGERIISPAARRSATLTPIPPTLAANTVATQPPTLTLSPTAVAGSFADFQAFAAEIAQALKDGNAAFFAGRASPSDWNCLGDETQGVCAGRVAGQHLQGLPITQDWKTYEFYNLANYQGLWQTAFDQGLEFRLVAVANRFGDNPLMPMAGQSFQAILASNDPTSTPVHVLFFEYANGSWRLQGELVTIEHSQDWLRGDCANCYDSWMAWPK